MASGALITIGGAVTAGAASGVLAGVIGGAIVGAAIGGITAAIRGGNILKGVLVGAVGGAVYGGVAAYAVGSGALASSSSGAEVVGSYHTGSVAAGNTATQAAAQSTATVNAASSTKTIGSLGLTAKDGISLAGSVISGLGKGEEAEAAAEEAQLNREHQQRLTELNNASKERMARSSGGGASTAARLQYKLGKAQLDHQRAMDEEGLALNAAKIDRQRNALTQARTLRGASGSSGVDTSVKEQVVQRNDEIVNPGLLQGPIEEVA